MNLQTFSVMMKTCRLFCFLDQAKKKFVLLLACCLGPLVAMAILGSEYYKQTLSRVEEGGREKKLTLLLGHSGRRPAIGGHMNAESAGARRRRGKSCRAAAGRDDVPCPALPNVPMPMPMPMPCRPPTETKKKGITTLS
jgi:hypothetical protein